MKAGRAIYVDECAACHNEQGSGITRLLPTLKGSPFVQQSQPDLLLHVVLNGTRAVATEGAPTGPAMPAFGWKLNDQQVAAVTTFVRNAWGNAAPAVAASEVANMRHQLDGRN